MIGLASLRAQVRRRLLISYDLDAEVARELLPDGLRPSLVGGRAVAGICLIGLSAVRPSWIGARVGLRSENVAHRIAVDWDQDGSVSSGVYIAERHSSSWLPAVAGGRVFPGVQKHGRFVVDESDTRFAVTMDAPGTHVAVHVELSSTWSSELFASLDEASAFYRRGAVGWSPALDPRSIEPMEATTTAWAVRPGTVTSIESSFFDALPRGSARLDSALVMQDVPFVWSAPHLARPRASDLVT